MTMSSPACVRIAHESGGGSVKANLVVFSAVSMIARASSLQDVEVVALRARATFSTRGTSSYAIPPPPLPTTEGGSDETLGTDCCAKALRHSPKPELKHRHLISYSRQRNAIRVSSVSAGLSPSLATSPEEFIL